ncbi:MAG: UDP-N-acetylmuramoyl-tripeptide--D-alanyl-D-alanine ligase [Suilimivivens sp.]
MKNMTLEAMAKACRGELCGNRKESKEASCVVIDSRKIEKDGVFIATRGERVDGHDFIPQVAEKGALAVVCEKRPEGCDIPYILVKDSFQALKDLAEFYRQQLSIPVIGITGSVGKTSTKEMIASVLSEKFCILKTEGNFNNEVGLPLTVLRIRKEHEAAVLEMGISNFGEMHRLSKIARPDICVMTNIGQCHLENLGSREGILKAKSEIFDYMNPEGYIFVNGDDDMLLRVKGKGSHSPVHFGLNPVNEVFASDVMNRGLLGSHAVIHMGLSVFPVEIPLPGVHMVNNALAAAAVGNCLGLTKEQIQAGISKVEAVGGRSHVMSLPSYTVIDDCYNANPVSMKAAIDLLTMALGRKVAILGDMFELGEREKELHAEVGAYAMEKEIDTMICVGELSEFMYKAACRVNKKSEVHYFATREEMLASLKKILKPGDSILVKASHSMQFEKVVEFLAAL